MAWLWASMKSMSRYPGIPRLAETISLETADESRYLDITIPLGDTSPPVPAALPYLRP